jgi:hypothetical protein
MKNIILQDQPTLIKIKMGQKHLEALTFNISHCQQIENDDDEMAVLLKIIFLTLGCRKWFRDSDQISPIHLQILR